MGDHYTVYLVQRWARYKRATGNFTRSPKGDKSFFSKELAEDYARNADSGFSGDTSYRYEIKEITAQEIED